MEILVLSIKIILFKPVIIINVYYYIFFPVKTKTKHLTEEKKIALIEEHSYKLHVFNAVFDNLKVMFQTEWNTDKASASQNIIFL